MKATLRPWLVRNAPPAGPLALAIVAVATSLASADVLELKSGTIVNGTYEGGTASTIRIATPQGVEVIPVENALALTFTGVAHAAAVPSPARPAPAAPASTAQAAQIVIPAGTTLLVRLQDPVSSRDPAGKRFTTTLETDITAAGVVVARAGTKVYGRIQAATQARRLVGQSTLDLRLSELAHGPSLIPLVTSDYADAGTRAIRKTAGGAAFGAAIGAIADGGDGAATGAAIGALASGLKRGQGINLSPGMLLEFRLEQPVTLTGPG